MLCTNQIEHCDYDATEYLLRYLDRFNEDVPVSCAFLM
jgi:hypothetical protein